MITLIRLSTCLSDLRGFGKQSKVIFFASSVKNAPLEKYAQDTLTITFIDLSNKEILNTVYRIFEKFYNDPQMKGHKRKYKSFISYLNRNYLSETAKFGHHKWNYYQSLCDDDFSITTNSLENVNGRFIIGRFIIE